MMTNSRRRQDRPVPRSSPRPNGRVPVPFRLFLGAGVVWAAAPVHGQAPGAATPAPALPLVQVEAQGSLSSEQKTAGTLKLTLPGGNGPAATNRWACTVRIHGATSQAYPKKSFGLTLSAPARLLDLRESAHWVLNAAFVDRSLMRHKLSYDLFRSLSTPTARRFAVASRFVEVRLNGADQGTYLLMEHLDAQLMDLRPFRSNDSTHACIYKAVDHAANFTRRDHAGFAQRDPDPLALPYWEPLVGLVRFVSNSSEADFFGSDHGIASRLDLDNAIDFHLLVLLTSNVDGITKNYILARDAVSERQPAPRFFFAPWDYDATFGRNWDATPVPASAWLSNHLFDRLMQDRSYRERFGARWRRLRQHRFSTATVLGLIDANARELGDAARRNADRWHDAQGYYPDHLSFEQDVTEMKQWVEERLRWLDAEIARRTAAAESK